MRPRCGRRRGGKKGARNHPKRAHPARERPKRGTRRGVPGNDRHPIEGRQASDRGTIKVESWPGKAKRTGRARTNRHNPLTFKALRKTLIPGVFSDKRTEADKRATSREHFA